jgi:hypothetical protein
MPASLLLLLALLAAPFSQALLTLEVRAFSGLEDVSDKSRIIVHAAGRREQAVGHIAAGSPRTVRVAPGIYDAQAVHEQGGRVVGIRWAERLVVMPYPDEAGHHLEVINFQTGFGALQVRNAKGAAPEAKVALFRSGERSGATSSALAGGPYALFVVRAGIYDVQVTRGTRVVWHAGIDVPLDRTRLWIVP